MAGCAHDCFDPVMLEKGLAFLFLQAGAEIPNGSFLHTIAVEMNGKTQYTTFTFG